jgi:hypothetical protein
MEDIKLEPYWNKTKGWPKNRWRDEIMIWEAETTKLEPTRQRQKSLEWSIAIDQNSCRVVVSEEEEIAAHTQ